jgi:hypothetical protein
VTFAEQEQGQAKGRSKDSAGGGDDFAHTDIYPPGEMGTAVNPMMSMSGAASSEGEIDQTAENMRLVEKVAMLEDENRRLRLEIGGDGGSRLSTSISIERTSRSEDSNSNVSVESADQTNDAVAL